MANPFKSVENKIKKGIESLGNKVKGQVESLGKDIRRQIESLGSKVKKEVEGVGKKAIKEVEGAADKVADEIEGVGKAAVSEIEEAAQDAKKVAEETVGDVEEWVEDKLEELAEALCSTALAQVASLLHTMHAEMEKLEKDRPELVDSINALGNTLQLGPLTLQWSGFYGRAENILGVLDKYANEPPAFRRGDIIEMIRALGPDSIDPGIDISFALGVGSKSLGVGGGFSDIQLDLFLELADVIMDELGVPE